MTQSSDDAKPSPPSYLRERSREFDGEARSILGEAFGDARYELNGSLRIAVIDLTETQLVALRAVSTRLGIENWVQIERADPTHLEMWERLRQDLRRMRKLEPSVLEGYPTPEPGFRRPPVSVRLAATGQSTAAELHERYGDFVSLRIGALPYPPKLPELDKDRPKRRLPDETLLSPDEFTVALGEALTVNSGETARTTLVISNLSDVPIVIHTNGGLTARIVSPESGAVVGGFAGAQTSPLIRFTAVPRQTISIPLYVGTASFDATLGYTIPPGMWQLVAPIQLSDGRHLVTPPLEFAVIS